MRQKQISILMAVLLAGMLTGCAGTVTNSRTDQKLESLRQAREEGKAEAEGAIKSYILSQAELNSVNSYREAIQQVLEKYVDSGETEDGQLKVTTANDSDRKDLCQRLTAFQKQIMEDAQNTGCTITFNGNLVNVVMTAEATKDTSDYVNAICVVGGLIQRVEKGYAEWRFEVNITNSENERITYQTVTNDQSFYFLKQEEKS